MVIDIGPLAAEGGLTHFTLPTSSPLPPTTHTHTLHHTPCHDTLCHDDRATHITYHDTPIITHTLTRTLGRRRWGLLTACCTFPIPTANPTLSFHYSTACHTTQLLLPPTPSHSSPVTRRYNVPPRLTLTPSTPPPFSLSPPLPPHSPTPTPISLCRITGRYNVRFVDGCVRESPHRSFTISTHMDWHEG